ncbi:Hsp20/alpha crystallin family protein [Olivibacter sp. SDN3]|uniref:Hsp20/alpha crystallin family protein n=1 Tax=Olivibacter sp. SDN3 TaxID=2764720 RepID=UPI0016517A5D|nr:Hsp20/alpha crystallin family protein [Olivibacter sp. SDN3]QNL50067.1 Hsp20/alpha crystallin family protein [Olivibacter sp. SDN3]
MSISRFVDNNKIRKIDPWVNNLFDDLFRDSFGVVNGAAKYPSVNVAESADAFHVEFAVPGFSKEDFKIAVEHDILTVSAEHKAEKLEDARRYSRKEFSYSSFKRSFTLPEAVDVDKIEASYKDGVLVLSVNKKKQEKVEAKEIAVK